MTIPSSVTGAELRGVTITNGTGTGAGLLNYGGVTLTECTVTGNQGEGGGGIYNEWDATLTLTRSSVSNNRAGSGGGAGIYNRFGTVTLNESIVTGNESSNQRGGGILNDGGILTLVGSRVERNQTGVHGGGIYYSAGARPTSVTLRGGSIVTDNDADPNDPESGGGIYNLFGNGTVEILDSSRVTGNRPNDCTGVICQS